MAKKKLIEVAMPLEAINEASSREKSIRHGHPSTLHLWWARRPLASARAVLFASLVDDPSASPEEYPTEEEQATERKRLFGLIEDLVQWENSNNEEVLSRAREEIKKSVGEELPVVYDPFAGGGTIPLEAQRLGLEAHASDLNPVAVLINKAMIEIPFRFAGKPPVHPEEESRLHNEAWRSAAGLAEDVRYYGQWMRDEAFKRIGYLYPKVDLPQDMGGGKATVIAWLWARTVPSPDPAFSDVKVPLISSFWLSKKKGREVYIKPVAEGKSYRFELKKGMPEDPELVGKGTKLGRGANFQCMVSGNPMSPEWIKKQGKSGAMDARLMAIVAEGDRGRVYLPSSPEMEAIAKQAHPEWRPEQDLPKNPRWFSPPDYGMITFGDIFTDRQLVALNTFSDLISEAREKVINDAVKVGLADDGIGIDEEGSGATVYGDAVATYLAFAVDKLADRNSTITTWAISREHARNTFGRQAIPMTWDFSEINPFSNSSGNFFGGIKSIEALLKTIPIFRNGIAERLSVTDVEFERKTIIATDPPYYDNIGYADLSDYFYVWLRHNLKNIYPSIFKTLLVPKAQELIATPFRFNGNKNKAEKYFENGMKDAFNVMYENHQEQYPLSLYYAFKQSEKKDEEGFASTGWETMLSALIESGFQVLGTWPIRTELSRRFIGKGTNALASSIILVCRKRAEDAPVTTRGKFISELHKELSAAVKTMQESNIPPVDLQQSAIGPGMAIYSKYTEIREASGTMKVHDALVLINQHLDEILGEAETDYDAYTRWAISWFEQFGTQEGEYGTAENLAKAKVVSVKGMVDAGFLYARGGKVRLLKREELESNWTPQSDSTFTIWEATQHLVHALVKEGENRAAELFNELTPDQIEAAKQLCYRLYNTCENKKWAQEAQGYNALIASFPSITEKARTIPKKPKQGMLL
jgi:putative DNA methylase